MKPLLPTLRSKRRYVAFEVLGRPAQQKQVWQAIQQSVLEQEGVQGLARQELSMPAWNQKSQKGILRVSHKHVTNLIADTSFVTSINNQPSTINTIRTSGMIKNMKEIL
ncbi:ribonuclease P protein component 2 [Candidatus Woesearchaeota archaeon]|nr:ribonuclease P protein component 2 [Candidatus Woesearchaeota archaeon]|tara:strand:- start:1232 stop:1558 length:327 start_codon:yes stop_codon:yes gene_type:complete